MVEWYYNIYGILFYGTILIHFTTVGLKKL